MSENPEPRTSKNPERPKVGPQRPNPKRPKNETPNVQKQLGDECKFRGFLCALWAQGWEMYIYKNMSSENEPRTPNVRKPQTLNPERTKIDITKPRHDICHKIIVLSESNPPTYIHPPIVGMLYPIPTYIFN